MSLGAPRIHYREIASTSLLARELALAGAPHGTLVTAEAQTDGRGRQGRSWYAPPRSALLCSFVLRDPPALLPLVAGVAVAGVIGDAARLKWPNDVLLPDARKVSGILVEGRPQERWAVLGIGINVALDPADLPAALGATAGTLGLEPAAIEPTLASLLAALDHWLDAPANELLEAWRKRDALQDADVSWSNGNGRAEGIDERGRLLVRLPDGSQTALDAGEVHLTTPDAA